jgi:hypothetical protein
MEGCILKGKTDAQHPARQKIAGELSSTTSKYTHKKEPSKYDLK